MNALTPISSNVDAYRASTDAAGICKDIVVRTATTIQGRKYVCVEGWQAIAIAHGCAAGARDVERVDGGVRAIGEVRRMSDGTLIATAEGFVGEDEPTWYGGNSRGKTLPKRADYAIRAMAQTRAISRACRSAFAHVVVMMNAGLATTPAEEVPFDGFDNGNVIDAAPAPRANGNGHNRDAPFPQGPCKNKTELKAKGRDFWREVEGCGDADELDALVASHTALVNQLREALPDWWNGGTKDGEPYEGLGDVITRKQNDFAAAQLAADRVNAG